MTPAPHSPAPSQYIPPRIPRDRPEELKSKLPDPPLWKRILTRLAEIMK
jgi:hypothetical protein